ncbi:tip elongation aberrant protein 1-like [Colias croceus]|uniref:tip elongation aberrant protein 1-like n=1 Tax=Colias crocea TaxID=72248 RepID=UPI001E2804A3|nr:tip elongation aberrant protein 1-like [Colias croceus]
MSFKSKTRLSPRAMPIEAVVTRFKSAQLKTKKDKPLQKKSNKTKSPSKKKVIENIEYFPNKLKRRMDVKKVVLLPKHDYKVVAGKWNKRKPCVPRKETYINQYYNDIPSPEHLQKEQTITDMIKLIEDTGNFDDDDLMEILTCPSPVWWEDPPDGYVEGPISRFTPELVNTKLHEESSKENKVNEEIKFEEPEIKDSSSETLINQKPLISMNIKIKDPKFIKKRGKLESLLGNLKDKINKQTNIVESDKKSNSSDLINTSMDEDLILTSLENMEIPIKKNVRSQVNDNEKSKIKTEQLDVKKVKITEDLKESDKILNSLNDIKNNVIKDASLSALKYLETDTSDFVTVYKIINNDTTDSRDTEKNGQINSYFKNCKNVRRQAKRKTEETDKKCIVVSDKETVKYCLKCSAIFDTEDCIYCMQKIKANS